MGVPAADAHSSYAIACLIPTITVQPLTCDCTVCASAHPWGLINHSRPCPYTFIDSQQKFYKLNWLKVGHTHCACIGKYRS